MTEVSIYPYPYRMGLIIPDEMKRTNEEDARDSLIKGHRFEDTPISYSLKEYDTSIKDQKECGSCVGFGSVKSFEVTKKFADQDASEKIDLSEADLFSVIGTCGTGTTLEKANSRLQDIGVCTEVCYPYDDFYNGKPSQPCANTTRIKILSAGRITSDAVAKAVIASGHAVQFGMHVDSDYFDVDSDAVYTPTYGDYAGDHCQSIIGYDDKKGAWLVDNSWGNTWGFSGRVWIAYGTCGIFRDIAGYYYTVTGVPPVATTGVHINTGGLKAEVLALDGVHMGFTDQDIALPAGSYKAVCKLAGYYDYFVSFDVVDKTVTLVSIIMVPLPQVDITVPRDGVMSATVIYVSSKAKPSELLVNGKSMGVLKKYTPVSLGKFNKGDGLQFDITGATGHNVTVHSFGWGTWMQYFITIGLTKGGYDVSMVVQEK